MKNNPGTSSLHRFFPQHLCNPFFWELWAGLGNRVLVCSFWRFSWSFLFIIYRVLLLQRSVPPPLFSFLLPLHPPDVVCIKSTNSSSGWLFFFYLFSFSFLFSTAFSVPVLSKPSSWCRIRVWGLSICEVGGNSCVFLPFFFLCILCSSTPCCQYRMMVWDRMIVMDAAWGLGFTGPTNG